MWKWGWRIGAQVLRVAIVLVIFANLRDRHDALIIGILGVLYTVIRTIGIGISTMLSNFALYIQSEFNLLSRHIADDYFESGDRADLWREAKQMVAELNENTPPMQVGLGIISLICWYEIFSSVFNWWPWVSL